MVGAGLVGLATAWLLSRQGHAVQLLDAGPEPRLDSTPDADNDALFGSRAALGLLMAQVYRRSSGRGWRLRQHSLALWQAWRQELQQRGHAIPFRAGLLQLARSAEELQAQRRLVEQRQRQGLPLRMIEAAELETLQPALPPGALGGVFSPEDGQLDPLPAMAALLADGRRLGLQLLREQVVRLERGEPTGEQRWRLHTAAGQRLGCRWAVLSAGLASPALLEPLGHRRPQSPVLGQALELELPSHGAAADGWPGSVSWGGINLVPRPNRRLWLGATLEPQARCGDAAALEQLRNLEGAAPEWLREARPLRHWQGLRARPDDRPAPLLEQLEAGLLLAAGHYRNGVLLAPASAAWVAEQIANEQIASDVVSAPRTGG